MSQDRALFSVVIPTRDRLASLEATIPAVLSQTFQSFEVVVVDDGSQDATAEFVDGIADGRVRLITQKPAGVSVARNRGAAASMGRFLVFLDSDDIPQPGWLGAFAESLDVEETVLVCMSSFRSEDGSLPEREPLRDLGAEFHHQRGSWLAGTFAISSDLFRELGRYDERLSYAENQELFLRAIPCCLERNLGISLVEEPQIRITERVECRRYDIEKLQSLEVLLSTHRDRLLMNRRMLANLYGVRGVAAVRLDRFDVARRDFASALAVDPLRVRNLARFAVSLWRSLARRVWDGIDSGGSQPQPRLSRNRE